MADKDRDLVQQLGTGSPYRRLVKQNIKKTKNKKLTAGKEPFDQIRQCMSLTNRSGNACY